MRQCISFLLLGLCLLAVLSGCKKETVVVEDNNSPYYDQIPDLLLENYVNRLYIDLIGREPLDTEMASETALLRTTNAAEETRLSIIRKLQTDTSFVAEDSSYRRAYIHWFYESVKGRFVEGASGAEIDEFIGPIQQTLTVILAADSVDWTQYYATLASLNRLILLKEAEYGLMEDTLSLPALTSIMLDNQVYDEINMGSFNFVRASFDNSLHRFPTESEFLEGFGMVEDGEFGTLLGQTSYGKQGFVEILTNSIECYQGWLIWTYRRMLQRDPSTEETSLLLQGLYQNGDITEIERHIMGGDEYAGF